jgi:carboxylesterase
VNVEVGTFFLGPEETNIACLLVHGFSGIPEEMRSLGEALAAQGIRVYAVLLAGHGGTPKDLAHATRKQWIACVESGLAELNRYHSVFVAGLSMGGVLSLLMASIHPERVAGVIAMSTPTRFARGWQVKLGHFFVKWYYPLMALDFSNPKVQEKVLQQTRLHNPDVTLDFSDPHVVSALKRSVRVSVSALNELVSLTDEVRAHLGTVRSPLLIIQSKGDQTVPPACAEELFRLATAASPKSLHWLEQSDHVITTGPEREEVFRLVTSFIQSTVQARNV